MISPFNKALMKVQNEKILVENIKRSTEFIDTFIIIKESNLNILIGKVKNIKNLYVNK